MLPLDLWRHLQILHFTNCTFLDMLVMWIYCFYRYKVCKYKSDMYPMVFSHFWIWTIIFIKDFWSLHLESSSETEQYYIQLWHSELHVASFPFCSVPGPLFGVCINCYHQCIHLQPAETFDECKWPERFTNPRLESQIHTRAENLK